MIVRWYTRAQNGNIHSNREIWTACVGVLVGNGVKWICVFIWPSIVTVDGCKRAMPLIFPVANWSMEITVFIINGESIFLAYPQWFSPSVCGYVCVCVTEIQHWQPSSKQITSKVFVEPNIGVWMRRGVCSLWGFLLHILHYTTRTHFDTCICSFYVSICKLFE